MTRPAPRGSVDRGRATRERLLGAAVELVGEAGWGAVTTRMVADRAGVRPGLVHYHFASVEDLLVTACTGMAGELLGGVQRALTAHDDLDAGLDWLLAALRPYTGTDPASLVLTEAFLAAGRIPRLHAELAGYVAAFRTGVAGWLRALGHTTDADAGATVLAATIDGFVLHRTLDHGLDPAMLFAPLRRMLATGTDVERP